MAIDTQEKRMSAATAGRIWMRATFPSGTFDERQRVSAGAAYAGNALSASTVILGPYCVAAGEVFVAGVVRGEVFVAGAVAGQGGCN